MASWTVAVFRGADFAFPAYDVAGLIPWLRQRFLVATPGLVLFEHCDDLRLGEAGLFSWWFSFEAVALGFSTHFGAFFTL
jgi:hypothetical protein